MSNTTQTSSNNIAPSGQLQFFITLARMQSVVSRRFDHMGAMTGLQDFIILHHLYNAPGYKLRRIDLAEKVGLTASGITRLLPPLEKIGLVGREADPRDMRVSYVTLAPGGLRVFMETLERAEQVAQSIVPPKGAKNIARFTALLEDIKRLAV
jgi:DNA-binding MarR family transcriptional regulator